MVLFITLLGKGLTQEIYGNEGNLLVTTPLRFRSLTAVSVIRPFLFQERESAKDWIGQGTRLLLNEQGNVTNTNVSPLGVEDSVSVVAPTSLQVRRKSLDNLPHTIRAFKLAGVTNCFKSIRTTGPGWSKVD